MIGLRFALAAMLLALAAGCPAEPREGPVDPHWDRDACEHCQMTVGDRRFAAQVRLAAGGRVHHFDDLGCAAAWLEDQEGGTREAAEVHVRALSGESWLDARTARYVSGQKSPMGYGLGAVAAGQRAEDALSFEDALALLHDKESRRHGAHTAP